MNRNRQRRQTNDRIEQDRVVSRYRVGIAIAVTLGVAIAGYLFTRQFHSPAQVANSNSPGKPLAVASSSAGYVGVDACRECHTERVDHFKETNHFRTCRFPQTEEMLEKFSAGPTRYQTRQPDCWFEMAVQGDRFVQTAVTRTAAGEQRRSEQIGLVYGAGTYDEVFHYWQGNGLFQMPVAYLNPTQEWGNSPGYLDGDVKFTRETGPRCVECHNTYFEHIPGTPNQYRRENIVLGVTCERCHGPGEQHVRHHRSHPEDAEARYVVQPANLSRERQLDLCSQCHSSADKHRRPAFSYRPGEPLEKYYRFAHGMFPEEEHTANQLHYLRQSKCFQSDETMTCVNCHDPHQPEGVENSAAVENSCYGCHQPEHCGARPSLPSAVRNRCIDCHMPRHKPMNIWFSSATDDFFPIIQRHDHRIAVHPEGTKEVLLSWYRKLNDASSQKVANRLTDELAAHRLQQADQLKQDYRFLAAIGVYREALRLSSTPAIQEKLAETQQVLRKLKNQHDLAVRQIEQHNHPAAIKTLQEMLQLKPNLAMAHGQLGTLLASSGQLEAGVSHLKMVAKYDPNLPYGVASLGQIYGDRGELAEAVRYYQQAVDIDPSNAIIHFHYGQVLAKSRRLDEAAEHLRRSLEINPQQQEVYYKLANLLILQRRPEEAIKFLEQAVQVTGTTSVAILMTLADTYAEVGRYDRAIATAGWALELSEHGETEILTRIQKRLETFKQGGQGISPP